MVELRLVKLAKLQQQAQGMCCPYASARAPTCCEFFSRGDALCLKEVSADHLLDSASDKAPPLGQPLSTADPHAAAQAQGQHEVPCITYVVNRQDEVETHWLFCDNCHLICTEQNAMDTVAC